MPDKSDKRKIEPADTREVNGIEFEQAWLHCDGDGTLRATITFANEEYIEKVGVTGKESPGWIAHVEDVRLKGSFATADEAMTAVAETVGAVKTIRNWVGETEMRTRLEKQIGVKVADGAVRKTPQAFYTCVGCKERVPYPTNGDPVTDFKCDKCKEDLQ